MFVYNITTKVNHEIATAWLMWQKEHHIPRTMLTGLFNDYKIFELVDNSEMDGSTYVIQYFADSQKNYDKFVDEFAEELDKISAGKWGDATIGFRTTMKVV